MRRLPMIIVTLVTTTLLAAAASVEDLLAQLRRAVERNDRHAVAALIQYPITITAAGLRIPVRDAAALVRSYDAVFTSELESAVRDGSAIRSGLIRVTAVAGVLKITGISLPARPPRADGATARPRGTQSGPKRVVFGAVQQTVQLSGSLSPGGSDVYVMYLERGRLFEARIDGVRGRDVVLNVLDAKAGKPLDSKAAAGGRAWIGRVFESADYRIEVTRRAPEGGQWLPYVLVLRRR